MCRSTYESTDAVAGGEVVVCAGAEDVFAAAATLLDDAAPVTVVDWGGGWCAKVIQGSWKKYKEVKKLHKHTEDEAWQEAFLLEMSYQTILEKVEEMQVSESTLQNSHARIGKPVLEYHYTKDASKVIWQKERTVLSLQRIFGRQYS